MPVAKEFMDFLKEYKVVGLAVGFIMGVASTALVQSLVNSIIMPLINPLTPAGGWQNATITFGPAARPVIIGWGPFLSAVINFIVIAFVIFMIVKIVMRPEKITKV